MDLSAIIEEFNRRKAQAGQGIADTLGLQKKPADWFQQMQGTQQKFDQRENIHTELARIAEQMATGMVPPMIRERERASRTDPSAAAKPFTSEEIKQAAPFVTAAAPIAYHGTPHSFEKFDASKIGTGQGAQSYGHGLYFAENPKVAGEYARTIGSPSTDFTANGIKLTGLKANIADDIVNKGMDEAGRNAKANGSEFLKAFEELKNQNVSGNRSNMYQVNIPDKHAARMLDWDKPLSEQAGLKNLLESAGITMTDSKLKTGATAYGMLADRLGSKEAATAALKDAGIPGIKYLDQGSRNRGPWTLITGTGSKLEYGTEEAAKTALQAGLTRGEKLKLIEPAAQTRNFVVFDPAILEDVTRK